MSWVEARRRAARAEYARVYKGGHAAHQAGAPIKVPADVVVLDRDPSPCVRCGEREGCRHRSAFGWGA